MNDFEVHDLDVQLICGIPNFSFLFRQTYHVLDILWRSIYDVDLAVTLPRDQISGDISAIVNAVINWVSIVNRIFSQTNTIRNFIDMKYLHKIVDSWSHNHNFYNNITIIRVHVRNGKINNSSSFNYDPSLPLLNFWWAEKSMEIVCNIIARVRHIIDAIFGAAYLIAFILLAVGCGHNKWICKFWISLF